MNRRTPGSGSFMMAAFAVQEEMDELGELTRRPRSVRSAKELVALGDQHWDRFPDKEMVVLFQHLRELGMCHPEYDEEEWRELQVQLHYRDIPITVFGEEPDTRPRISDMELSNLFHRLWTKHRKGYNKMSWRVFHRQLVIRKLHL